MDNRTKFVLVLLVLAAWFGGAAPTPKPPDPQPPAPVVIEGVEWVVIVEQSEARSLEVAKLVASGWLDRIKAKYRVFDYDNPTAAAYRPKADEVGMPAVFLQDANGKVLHCGPLDVMWLKGVVR